MLVEWNATAAAYPRETCLHQLFEAQVERRPDAVALVFGEETLSYGELNARATRLAHRLRGIGVGPDDRVAVCVDRSVAMVVALLAVLKAGGAYVPLDPAYPAGRLAYMLEDSAPVALLTHRRASRDAACRRSAPASRVDLGRDGAQLERTSRRATRTRGRGPDAAAPGVRDLHVGFDGAAQGGDGRAPRGRQPGRGATASLVRLRPRRRRAAVPLVQFRRLGVGDLGMALLHGAAWW